MPQRRCQQRRSTRALALCTVLGSLCVKSELRRGRETGQSSDVFVPGPGRCRHDFGAGAACVAAEASLSWATPAGAAGLPPAPSGVNALPEAEQAVVVLAIFAGLALSSWTVAGPGFSTLEAFLPNGWFRNWQRTWPIIGIPYMAAGSAHFSAQDAFEAIYPPEGTWGFWYLPGSPTFHVQWTGVAELAGGAGLFFGSLLLGLCGMMGVEAPNLLRQLPAAAALGLFVLTWAVTPANVYMYTHGAQMVGLTPGDQPIPVEFHAVRGVLQVVLLSFLWGYYRSSSQDAQRE